MAPVIKSLAPNTLITVGEEGFFGEANPGNPGHPGTWAAGKGQNFLDDHASDAIDFAAVHLWYVGWRYGVVSSTTVPTNSPSHTTLLHFDTHRADNWQDTSPEFIGRFLSSRIESTAAMGKPLLLEEWGSFPANRDSFMRSTYEQIESAMKSGGLQGSAFWQWYLPGQLAAASEQSYGPGGMYGIYDSDPIWSRIVENAKFTQALNSETISGCSLDAAKKANVPAVASCEAGKEGPTCSLNVNECLRGLDNCHENAACIDTDEGFTCECFYGYTGDGTSCTQQPDVTAELKSKYFTTPQTVSCQLAIPVNWPVTVPGGLYDPLDSQQYVIDIYGGHRGSGDRVDLLQCMIACQMDATCESFVINEVQGKCLLTRGQCPNYLCESIPEVCVSVNDVGETLEVPCGYWQTYYRLDGDVERSCEAFEKEIPLKSNVPPEGLALIEGVPEFFAAFLETSPGTVLRSSDPADRDLIGTSTAK